MGKALDRKIAKVIRSLGHEDKLAALYEVADQIESDVLYGKLLRDAWIGTEMFTDKLHMVEKLMAHRGVKWMMTDQEKSRLKNMPSQFTVYRGAVAGLNDLGWSWTLNRKTAIWFAKRFCDGDAVLYEVTVKKETPLALIEARGEEEVILDPRALDPLRIETTLLGSYRMNEMQKLALLARAGLLDTKWMPRPIADPTPVRERIRSLREIGLHDMANRYDEWLEQSIEMNEMFHDQTN